MTTVLPPARAGAPTGVDVESPRPLDTTFRSALRRLDAAGRLVKVGREVDAHLELSGLMRRHDGDRALLFERVRGHDIPVVGNVLCSPANCEAALGLDQGGLRALMARALGTPRPPQIVADGPAQTVIHTGEIDLGALLPVLHHAPGDAGRFVTAGVVIARDPATGVANASYHRLQLLGGNRTGIRLDHARHLRAAWEEARRRGADLEIAVCLGTDLALMYTAAFMGSQMPASADELAAAGALAGRALPMVRARTVDLAVPAETEIVLEGTISATETVEEGPFGEFLGYHSDVGPAPVVTFRAVTTRLNPVYHAINGAGRETIMLRKYVLEAAALTALRQAVPIVTDVELTGGGLHRFHLVLQIARASAQQDGMQRNAMLAAFATLKDLDLVIAVDDDIDCHDPRDVEYAVATRMEASRDLLVMPEMRGHEYIRVSRRGIRAKLGIDATVPFADRDRFRRIAFADVALDPADARSTPGAPALPWL